MHTTSSSIRLAGAIISNPSKPFWPDEGLTKLRPRAVLRAHRLADPALDARDGGHMERCPEGIRKTCFYQKQAPNELAAGVPTVTIPAPPAGRDVDYIVGGRRKTLLALVNSGLHRDARDEQPRGRSRSAGLAGLRSRSGATASSLPRSRAARCSPRARGPRAGVVREDVGRPRPARVRAAAARRAQDQVRAYATGIAAELAARASEARHRRSAKGQARAPVYLDVMRNAARADHRAAVLGAVAAARAGVDAARAGTKSARASTPPSSISGPRSERMARRRRGPASSATDRRCRGFRRFQTLASAAALTRSPVAAN